MYTLAPGADPALIRWRYTARAQTLTAEVVHQPADVLDVGDLRIVLDEEHPSLIERAPIAWQETGVQGNLNENACTVSYGVNSAAFFEAQPGVIYYVMLVSQSYGASHEVTMQLEATTVTPQPSLTPSQTLTSTIPPTPSNTSTSTATPTATATPPITNLLLNGSFDIAGTGGNPPAPWLVFGMPDTPPWSVNNGVFTFHRDTGSIQGVVYQHSNVAVPANGVLEAQFDLGNFSALRKRALILIHDGDFLDSSACTFWLPANTSLHSFRMKVQATKAWVNATISIYLSNPADDTPGLAVENVQMGIVPGQSFQGTLCSDPLLPSPPGGPDGPNLLDNFDFSQPLASNPLNAWSSFFEINAQIVNGVASIYRTGTPRGTLFQSDPTVIPAGTPVEATLELGNSQNNRKRVVILIHKPDFNDLGVCVFWLPPNTPLQTYTLRTVANINWTDGVTLSIYPDTLTDPVTLGQLWVDNITLRQRPALAVTGTECYAPEQVIPSQFDASEAQGTTLPLEPTATITPLLPPPPMTFTEAPVIATPTLQSSLGEAGEGDLREDAIAERDQPEMSHTDRQ